MASSDEEPLPSHSEAAHKAIRKHFPQLSRVVATGDIPDHLYAEEVIEESTFEVVTDTNVPLTNKQKGTKILKNVQIVVHSKLKAFDNFCRILKSEGHPDIVLKLRGMI